MKYFWAQLFAPATEMTTVLNSFQGDTVQVQAYWLPVAWPFP